MNNKEFLKFCNLAIKPLQEKLKNGILIWNEPESDMKAFISRLVDIKGFDLTIRNMISIGVVAFHMDLHDTVFIYLTRVVNTYNFKHGEVIAIYEMLRDSLISMQIDHDMLKYNDIITEHYQTTKNTKCLEYGICLLIKAQNTLFASEDELIECAEILKNTKSKRITSIYTILGQQKCNFGLFDKAVFYYELILESLKEFYPDRKDALNDIVNRLINIYLKKYTPKKFREAIVLIKERGTNVEKEIDNIFKSLSNYERLLYQFEVTIDFDSIITYDLDATVLIDDKEISIPDILIEHSSMLSEYVDISKTYKRIPLIGVSKYIFSLFNTELVYINLAFNHFTGYLFKNDLEFITTDIHEMVAIINFSNYLALDKLSHELTKIYDKQEEKYLMLLKNQATEKVLKLRQTLD